MKKNNIAILGTIGVGKTTLLHNIEEELLKYSNSVLVKAEPSVTVPFVNDVLKKFYNDNKSWSLCLQLLISSVQESYFQELRETDYDYALFDMPFSSDIYSYSHMKHGRMSADGHHSLVRIGSKFPFDTVILINEDKETTINRVKNRNTAVANKEYTEDKKDVEIEDFSYLDEHIADFKEYQEVWLTRFKTDNPDVKIIRINHVPDLRSEDYKKLLIKIIDIIMKGTSNEYQL